MFADRFTKGDVLFGDRAGIGEAGPAAFGWRQGQEVPAHRGERPLQIDRSRPRRGENGASRVEIRVRWPGAHGQRQTIGRRHADEGRATHLHILDGASRLGGSLDRNNFEFMRQPRLIDDGRSPRRCRAKLS